MGGSGSREDALMKAARVRDGSWLWWLAVVAYVALIFLVSSRPSLRSPVTFPLWDKVVHLVEYALLGFLGLRAVHASWSSRGGARLPVRVVLVLGCGLAVALLDELFQSTVPGRDASVWDFLVDVIGLIAGVGFARFMNNVRRDGAGEAR
jgi:VanZ family protein